MEDPPQIVCHAAGRMFKPNMLYNAATDTVLTGVRLWKDENVQFVSTPHQKTEVTSTSEDSFKSRSNLLNIAGSLKLSIMGGLIELSGSAKYLTDKKTSFTKERVALQYRCLTRFSEMMIPSAGYDNPDVVVQPNFATHLVTGVAYGGTAVFVFEREKSVSEEQQEISGSLQACVKAVAAKFSGGIEGKLTEDEKDNYSKVSCSYFGDFSLKQIPQNFLEALEVMKNIPQYVEASDSPVEVTMIPLSRIDTGAAKLAREISIGLVDDVGDYIQDLDDVLEVTKHLKQSDLCKNLRGIQHQLDDFSKAVSAHQIVFKQSVGRLIPKIRSTGEGEDELFEHLSSCQQQSPFYSKHLISWVEDRENELKVLQVWLKQLEKLGAKLVFKPGDLMVELAEAQESTLVIKFSSCRESKLVAALEEHLQYPNSVKKTGENLETGSAANKNKSNSLDTAWCSSESIVPFEKDLSEVLAFLQRNRKMLLGRIFVSEEINSGSAEEFKIHVWMHERGKAPLKFTIPHPPLQPRVFDCTTKEVSLSWQNTETNDQGNEGIRAHRIQYVALEKATFQKIKDGREVMSWQDLSDIHDMVVQSQREDHAQTRLKNLRSSTAYAFRIQAVTPLGDSAFSEASLAETLASTRCAIQIRDLYAKEIAKKSYETFPGKIFELKKTKLQAPRATSQGRLVTSVNSFDVGSSSGGGLQAQKVLLVVGETGTGKTTLLDGIANAFYKVQFEDDFRFKLVNEALQGSGQAVSQTQDISVYTLHPMHGSEEERSAVDFSLVLVDTPGFGDTRGLDHDMQTVRKLSDMLIEDSGVPGVGGVLHGIGLVVKASQSRLTTSQKYVFDQVLALFGKDTESIIMPLITFADQNEPRVIDALRHDKIPGDPTRFHVNNGMLFADNRQMDDVDTSKMSAKEKRQLKNRLLLTAAQWEEAGMAYETIFEVLAERSSGVTLKMTQDVLRDRQQLELAVSGAHRRVKEAQCELENILKQVAVIKTLNEAIINVSDYKTTVTKPHFEKVQVGVGQHTTLCLTCNRTCHEICLIPDNAQKAGCNAMKNGYCIVCPGKCYWNQHQNSQFILKETEVTEVITVNEIFEQYQVKTKDKEGKKILITKMLKKYEVLRTGMAQDISTIHYCLQSLDKIALRQYPLSVTEYIDLLITNEEEQRNRGWEERVRQLKDARKNAELISKARQGRDPLEDFLKKTLDELKDEDFKDLADNIIQAGRVDSTVGQIRSTINAGGSKIGAWLKKTFAG